MKIQAVLVGAFSVATLVLSASAAEATTEVFNFADNTDGIFAMGSFDVASSANANGTYNILGITGTVTRDGATPMVDQIDTLLGNPNLPNPAIADGFQYDNVTPLNVNGVLFQAASGAIYNLWSNGGPSNNAQGELYTYGGPVQNFDAHGTLSVAAVPEPATWAMMLIGFGGLGGALRGARRKLAAA